MRLISSAFSEGELIPRDYTCDGRNVSPPLTWSEVPALTRSFTLIVEDPDAPRGLFLHWLLYDLPPGGHALTEAAGAPGDRVAGGCQGRNGFGRIAYEGPCPPGGVHRYYFRLYAVDRNLEIPSGASREVVENTMRGHILAQANTMGRYRRALRSTV